MFSAALFLWIRFANNSSLIVPWSKKKNMLGLSIAFAYKKTPEADEMTQYEPDCYNVDS